jgi:hypothetical protein
MLPWPPSEEFATPFKVATYATTAAKSGRGNMLAKGGMAVPDMPRATVVAI